MRIILVPKLPGRMAWILPLLLLLNPIRATGQAWSWTTETIDQSGKFTSLAADEQGNLHLSYATDDQELKYAFRSAGSPRWFTMVLDQRLGQFYTRLTLDSSGNPHICYTPSVLKYARWDGQRWRIQEVGPRNGTVEYTCSVAVAPDGTPHLAWYQTRLEGSNFLHLRYAVLQDGAWLARTLDYDGEAGKWSSMVLDARGHLHISYSQFPLGELRYAYWDGNKWNLKIVDSPRSSSGLATGMGSSLVLTAQKELQISSYEAEVRFGSAGQGALKFARQKGTSWTVETVDRITAFGGWVGYQTSQVLDQRAFPHISYEDAGVLKHAYWDGKQWRIQVIAPRGSEPYCYSSIAIDRTDTLYISFRDPLDGSLKVAIGRRSPDTATAAAAKKEDKKD